MSFTCVYFRSHAVRDFRILKVFGFLGAVLVLRWGLKSSARFNSIQIRDVIMLCTCAYFRACVLKMCSCEEV